MLEVLGHGDDRMNPNIKAALFIVAFLGLRLNCSASTQSELELVMRPTESIRASFGTQKIQIDATSLLTRRLTWDGASREVTLYPRERRWHGSLGAYSPGAETFDPVGTTSRAVVDEGQLNFANPNDLRRWLHFQAALKSAFTTDGLFIALGSFGESQLNLNVYQLCINGRKPAKLQGADDSSIIRSGPTATSTIAAAWYGCARTDYPIFELLGVPE
jgi:hypothetical protein